jgi:capsular exopolysaccharide synthesis family protein
MELSLLWDIVRRRKWSVLQAVLVITGVASVIAFFLPNKYESTGLIYCQAAESTSSTVLSSLGLGDVLDMFEGVSGTDVIEDDLQRIQLRPYLEDMIHELLLLDAGYQYLSANDLLEPDFRSRLKGSPSISFSKLQDSSFIEIRAVSAIPLEAKLMVDTLAEIFIEKTVGKAKQQYRAARQFVEDQLQSVYKDYNSLLEQIKHFQQKHGAVDISLEVELILEKLAALQTEVEENRLELYETNASLKSVAEQMDAEDSFIVLNQEFEKNPSITELKNRLFDLHQQHAALQVEYKSKHPKLMVVQNQLETTKQDIKDEIQKILSSEQRGRSKVYDQLKKLFAEKMVQRSVLEVRNELIPELKASYEHELQKLPALIQEFSKMDLALKISEEVYSTLLEYKHSLGVAESMTMSRLDFVEQGALPEADDPSQPNRKLILFLGLFVGTLTGLGLAGVREYFDNTLKSLEEVEKESGLSLLGFIPKIESDKGMCLHQQEMGSALFEGYRTVRNNLRFLMQENRQNCFFVSSVREGEGKTLTACNLGLSLVNAGDKVLVVDLDLRRPNVHKTFGLSNAKGISQVILQGDAYTQVLQHVSYKDQVLDVLTSGPVPMDVGLLIESEKMRLLMDQLKQDYEYVIIDTTPLFAFSDVQIISELCPNFVWVMDLQKSDKKDLARAKNLFLDREVKILGFVSNKDTRSSKTYYSYYHKYYS